MSDPTKTVRYVSACSNPYNHTMSRPNNRFSTHARSGKGDTHIIIATTTTREKSHARFHGDLSTDQPVKLLNPMTNKPISVFFLFLFAVLPRQSIIWLFRDGQIATQGGHVVACSGHVDPTTTTTKTMSCIRHSYIRICRDN